MNQKLDAICREVQKALTGKQAVVEKVLMAMLCGGHILLDDVPGVGKTTLAVAFSKALGLRYRRIQFTPDVLPSDIVGFSMYDKQQNAFRYVPGIVSDTNLLLGDEINRTSSKTQSALLEAWRKSRSLWTGSAIRCPIRSASLLRRTRSAQPVHSRSQTRRWTAFWCSSRLVIPITRAR